MDASSARPFTARRRLVVLGLLAATVGLLWRVVDLQLNHKGFLQGQGDARHLRVVAMPAHRGLILDRNGEPLAVSTPIDSVWANPGELVEHPAQWARLSRALGLDQRRLRELLESRREREFLYLERHVQPALADRVRELAVPGVYLQREYRRYYPQGEVTAHVVGFTNVDDVGQEGMELAFDDTLRGVDGAKRIMRDRLGHAVEVDERITAPRPGADLVLSIDRRIQYLTYRALLATTRKHRARGGSAVVLDVRSGEVLAMVNRPSYNPNKAARRVNDALRNRAVTDVFEPGSTIKPFTVSAALESGLFRATSVVDTRPGLLRIGRHTVRDLRDYGQIDLSTIIKKSSNVGATKVALSLSPRQLWETLSRVGFGAATGSGFPGESPGVLTHFFEWGDVHRATHSFGYGLSVTTLQLAQAYAAMANEGRLASATLLRRDRPPIANRVMSADTARDLRDMLEGVVQAGGTGGRARVPGYRVGGKTGTVRKPVPGGYAEDRYVASFAGIAPLSSPRVAVVVVVDEPSAGQYYGGEVAAPAFAEITRGALRLLGIAPDDPSATTRRIALGGAERESVRPLPAARDPSTVASVAYGAGGAAR